MTDQQETTDLTLVRWAIAENMVTAAATAALVLGLYAMGAGGWAAGGFLLLLNLNSLKLRARHDG